VPRQKKPAGKPRDGGDLRTKILKLLAARALDQIEISKTLHLPPDQRGKLRELLRQMEIDGAVARIRKDRYVLPRDADLFTGTIQFHASGAAHVLNEKVGQPDLYISGENTFTAMHGDKVVARINRGRRPGESGRGRPGSPPERKEGQVIRILERVNSTIVGTLGKSKNFFYVAADDPRFVHNLYVPAPGRELGANIGDKVVASLDAWVSRHVNPEGHIVEVLGPPDRPGVDILSIIKKHRLPMEFPMEVQQEAGRISPQIDPAEIARREDLRGNFIFTIDPDDAKDFDDAINVERTDRGWRVGVHIADVSHYVQPKGPLDREAYARGNSVYLADRVIPMLPEALSNGLCSLRPDEDKLTFSVFAEINQAGKILSSRFARTVIRSKVRWTYKQAFAQLQKSPHDEATRHLHTAWDVSSLLRRNRFAHGSLDLDFPEVKVWLDDQGKPTHLEKIENDISHQLIEELMLLANELVGRELKIRRQPSVYRVHEKPEADKLAEFRETAAANGLRCGDLSNRPELQKLLALAKGKPQEYVVKLALLKSLKRARYAPDPLGHYGLNKSDYTHFTSPIRRYADLIVHRSLERQLGLTSRGPDSSALGAMAEHISTTERIATEAERDSTKLKKLEYFNNQLSKRTGQSFTARILDVRNYGMFVELPDFLISGLIHVSTLSGDFYILDEARGRMTGRKSKKTYQVGDEIEVIVAKVDFFKQQVDFQPAGGPNS
jgi:ribonuclease R